MVIRVKIEFIICKLSVFLKYFFNFLLSILPPNILWENAKILSILTRQLRVRHENNFAKKETPYF